jgi:hypothetical protein
LEKTAVDLPQPLGLVSPGGNRISLVLALTVSIFLIGGIGPNAALAVLSAVVFFVGGILLWRPGQPPVLLLLFGYQWVQASILIFQANWFGLEVSTRAPGGDVDTAILLTLGGLASMAIGMRWGAGAQRMGGLIAAQTVALSQPISRWFSLYLFSSAVATLALALAWKVPGLVQPLLALVSLKWAFFFMLAYATFVRTRSIGTFFVIAFALELALGIGGFFSDFKTVFFVTLLAGAASGKKLSARTVFSLGSFAALLIAFGVVWTAVKKDYRDFVSGGSGSQIVTVDYWTAVTKLGELVSALDGEALAQAGDNMVQRLSYVEFFASALEYVPNLVPHENGALMWDAISRPFMPRILFPDKASIDDSMRTNLYTGGAAGNYAGTSISLGWIAETYIDFGEFLMMAAIFLVGYFYGRIYRWCLGGEHPQGLMGFAFATAVLLPYIGLETSFTKTFGGVAASVVMVLLIMKFVMPRWFPWLAPAAPG